MERRLAMAALLGSLFILGGCNVFEEDDNDDDDGGDDEGDG